MAWPSSILQRANTAAPSTFDHRAATIQYLEITGLDVTLYGPIMALPDGYHVAQSRERFLAKWFRGLFRPGAYRWRDGRSCPASRGADA